MTCDPPEADAITNLVEALRTHDTERARRFDREARSRLVRFCQGYLRDRDTAEDAVQEALTRLVSAPEAPTSPRAWLFHVARNICHDRIREGNARPDDASLASSFDAARETAGPVTRMIGAEAQAVVQRALAKLTHEERELLRLRYTEDLPRREVAEIVALPESLIKSRLFEAVQKLRRALGGST